MIVQLSQVHRDRVLLTGVLVDILVVILNTFLVLLAFHIWGQPDQAQIAYQVASWSTTILAILLTVGGAVWVARKVEREAPLHGFLVGLMAALILFPFSPAFTNFFLNAGPFSGRLALLLVPFVLMVVAGWLGGVLSSRGRKKS